MIARPGKSSLKALHAVCGCALSLILSGPAFATQHLITPGDDWQSRAPRIRPGDEIILMPGRHSGATFERLVGTTEKPITIRGADPNKATIIEARREGIRVKRAANLVIKDLQITGATINGLSVSGVEPFEVNGRTVYAGNVRVRNVVVTKVGPRGLRHAIVLSGLQGVRIEDCRVMGWGGSGIELIACNDASIENCHLVGLQDHGQRFGIRLRAGCDRVDIEHCRIEHAGERGISLGAASEFAEFALAPAATDKPGTRFEASRVQISNCRIIGGQCAIALVNADDCVARRNTIFRPQHCVMAVLIEQKDERFTIGKRNVFGSNLIFWEPKDVTKLAETSPGIDAEAMFLEENLWWSKQTEQERAKLGSLPGKMLVPQTMEVDPRLDAKCMPTADAAKAYGSEEKRP